MRIYIQLVFCSLLPALSGCCLFYVGVAQKGDYATMSPLTRVQEIALPQSDQPADGFIGYLKVEAANGESEWCQVPAGCFENTRLERCDSWQKPDSKFKFLKVEEDRVEQSSIPSGVKKVFLNGRKDNLPVIQIDRDGPNSKSSCSLYGPDHLTRYHTRWWAYPLRFALIPPALVLDLINLLSAGNLYDAVCGKEGTSWNTRCGCDTELVFIHQN